MEFLRRMVCFVIGFCAAVALVAADDRMAVNYGYEKPWNTAYYAKAAALQAEEWKEAAAEVWNSGGF